MRGARAPSRLPLGWDGLPTAHGITEVKAKVRRRCDLRLAPQRNKDISRGRSVYLGCAAEAIQAVEGDQVGARLRGLIPHGEDARRRAPRGRHHFEHTQWHA